eukprot:COSAG01_NODE_7899_length_3000_cov_12.889004_1_plen_277_part_00
MFALCFGCAVWGIVPFVRLAESAATGPRKRTSPAASTDQIDDVKDGMYVLVKDFQNAVPNSWVYSRYKDRMDTDKFGNLLSLLSTTKEHGVRLHPNTALDYITRRHDIKKGQDYILSEFGITTIEFDNLREFCEKFEKQRQSITNDPTSFSIEDVIRVANDEATDARSSVHSWLVGRWLETVAALMCSFTFIIYDSTHYVETITEMSGSGSGSQPLTSSCQDQTQIECIIGNLTKVLGTGAATLMMLVVMFLTFISLRLSLHYLSVALCGRKQSKR